MWKTQTGLNTSLVDQDGETQPMGDQEQCSRSGVGKQTQVAIAWAHNTKERH